MSRHVPQNLSNAIRAVGQLPTIGRTDVSDRFRSPPRATVPDQREKSRQRLEVLLQRRRKDVERQKEEYEGLKISRDSVKRKMEQSARKTERPRSTDVIKYMDYPWDLANMAQSGVQEYLSVDFSRNPSPWQSDVFALDK
eukprot:179914-Hanusia_phi.AAC.3